MNSSCRCGQRHDSGGIFIGDGGRGRGPSGGGGGVYIAGGGGSGGLQLTYSTG